MTKIMRTIQLVEAVSGKEKWKGTEAERKTNHHEGWGELRRGELRRGELRRKGSLRNCGYWPSSGDSGCLSTDSLKGG